MANYFFKFPKVFYSFNNNRNVEAVTNIISRFALEEKFKENTSSYFNHTIIDGETPEIIASKVYNNPERHWIILMMNDIVDPQYDWPLTQDTFYKHVDSKYSVREYADTANTSVTGLEWAKSETHSYYKREIITKSFTEPVITDIQISETDYNDLLPTVDDYTLNDGNNIKITINKFEKTYLEYENEVNENKRVIKVLKREFINDLENELELAANGE
jgi:hypothetical protein